MHLKEIAWTALALLLVGCGEEEIEICPLAGHDFTVGDWLLVFRDGGRYMGIYDRHLLHQHQRDLRSSPKHDPSCTTPQSWITLYKDGSQVASFPACDHLNMDFGALQEHLRPMEHNEIKITSHDQFLNELKRLRAEKNTYVVPPENIAKQYDGLLEITLIFNRDIDDDRASEMIRTEFNRLYGGFDCSTEVSNSSISFNPVKKGYRLKVYCDEAASNSFEAGRILESDVFDHAHVGEFERHSYELTYFTY